MPFKKLLLSACVCSLFSLPANAETLADAVEATLNYHPSVEAAIANRDASHFERSEKVSGFFPTVNARAAGGRIYGDNSTSRGLSVTRGAGYSYMWEGSVSVTQPLFNGFETMRRLDAADARREAARVNVADVRENLALRTVIAYLDVLKSRETLAKLRAQLKTVEDYRGRIRKMVDSGAADETMAVQARDIQVQLENTIANTEGQLLLANAGYREMTGHEPDESMTFPDLKAIVFPASVEEAVVQGTQNHPVLQVAVHEEEAQSYDARAESGPLYPDVNGELSYLKRDQDDVIGGEAIDARALVRVNWSFDVGGAQISRMRAQNERYIESKAQRRELERQLEKEIRAAWTEMQTAKSQQKLLEERVALNTDLLETSKTQFEGAVVNLLQLMQADNALFNAKMALLNGKYRLASSQFSALANIGGLQDTLRVSPAHLAHDKTDNR